MNIRISQMPLQKKMISIISPCYNEVENIEEIYLRVKAVMSQYPQYEFEYLFIDNASTDGTDLKLKMLADLDKRVKVIINTRNFGHIRSPYWGLIQTSGDASIYLASDLQDPPELIPTFIDAWEEGYKVVLAIKPFSKGNRLLHQLRKSYYSMLDGISDVTQIKDATGFGLYDRTVLNEIRSINDPYPYFRGLIAELGYEVKAIPFTQPRRLRGVSKNNFYTLYDVAMLGITSHSKVPLRIATFVGFALGISSVMVALVFLVLKLLFWDSFSFALAPILIGLFFLFGVLLIFIGILGEYIGSIHSYLQRRPIVVEKERINF
jgi:glycosyltransferase involved in cell wall biosynthesis